MITGARAGTSSWCRLRPAFLIQTEVNAVLGSKGNCCWVAIAISLLTTDNLLPAVRTSRRNARREATTLRGLPAQLSVRSPGQEFDPPSSPSKTDAKSVAPFCRALVPRTAGTLHAPTSRPARRWARPKSKVARAHRRAGREVGA